MIVWQLHYSFPMNQIKELEDSQESSMLLQSLQKGNIQLVTTIDGNNSQKIFIEANPQFKTINIYDTNFRKIEKESLTRGQSKTDFSKKEIAQTPSTSKELKQKRTQAGDHDDIANKADSIKKKRKKGLSQ